MATLYIAEFYAAAVQNGNASPVAEAPPVAEQTIAIGGGSTPSAAFNAKTGFIRVHTDAICSIALGTTPTASDANMRLAANQTEYFAVPRGASFKIAVITNS